MRYYGITLKTNEEQIKANTKVRLNDYSYDGAFPAVNNFIQKNTPPYISFFIYNVDNDISFAAFSYDEQKDSLQSVYESICEMLSANFDIGIVDNDPSEITMTQFKEYFLEGKRHDFVVGAHLRIVDASHMWIYHLDYNEVKGLPFTMEECIASLEAENIDIYDESFISELNNINEHKLKSAEDVNMAHYILSGNSRQAEFKLAESLVLNLYNANRLSSKRIVYISDMKPYFFDKNHYIEDILDNNFGGTVVFDLTEKFGVPVSEYVAAGKYIEKLFKKYNSHCLFIFTYSVDNAGFSYYLLPEINKRVITVPLKEGKGNRKAATQYLCTLISASEHPERTKYAKEFMKTYDGDQFSQTDVIEAYERFEPWCINKLLKGNYRFNTSEDFMLDREDGSSLEKLDRLIGLEIVKKQIENIIATDIVEKERKKHGGKEYQSISSHMIFAGNPGSAKTTVAELFAGIAKEKGVLKSGIFVERGGMDLDGMFCVQAIREAFTAAQGGVLFIDEAYSMKSDTAVSVLIQEMENQRDNVIVILAGYSERMRNFLEINEGLKSRVPHWVDFPDYSTEELTEIFHLMLNERGLRATEEAVNAASVIFDKMRLIENFGNGRFVRNLIDRALLNQSSRLKNFYMEDDIPEDELFTITKADISCLHENLKDIRKPGEAKEELSTLIGLESAKDVVNKAIAKFKLDKIRMDMGIPRTGSTMHMVFTGNPGTAKTTVARLCAEIMTDEKLLSTGNFVEVGRADLVGDHVGSTARIVKQRFREAQGGVLFIDEAYSLCDHHEGSFGDEAINTIVQEMENHREDMVVIFAGYPEPMKDFLERNPGMKSRIAFHVKFDDYSTEELCEIASLMAANKQMTITDDAMEKLRRNCDAARVNSDFGNGRFVRKLLEEAEMNLAVRIVNLPEEELTSDVITTIEASDIPKFTPEQKNKPRIGFAC